MSDSDFQRDRHECFSARGDFQKPTATSDLTDRNYRKTSTTSGILQDNSIKFAGNFQRRENQSLNNCSSEYPHQASPPYPTKSPPYPTPGGAWAHSRGFNVGLPMPMPQPFDGVGYPSPTSCDSYNSPYPQSPNYPTYYPTKKEQSYCHLSHPTAPLSVYTSNPFYSQSSSCPNSPEQTFPQPSSYVSNRRQTDPQIFSYVCKQTQIHPSSNQRHSFLQFSHYSNIRDNNSPHSPHSKIHQSGYSNPAPTSKKSPTVVPASPFNPQQDVAILRRAMQGFRPDEKTIINVLTRRSSAQRLEIAAQFSATFGKNLIKLLKIKLSGNLKRTIVALLTPLPQYYAKEIYNVGFDESVLTEVLCALSNAEVRAIREAYHTKYHKHLENDVKEHTSRHFRHLMGLLCSASRDESMLINPAAAAADAQTLLCARESTFIVILCKQNYEQLHLVFQEFQKIVGHDIEEAIKNEFSGDIKDGLLAVIRSIKNQQAFFAQRLYKSMKGLGTNDSALVRLVVTRCEIDMGDIKRKYALNHGESLAAAIKGDTSGNYKNCLLALIGEK